MCPSAPPTANTPFPVYIGYGIGPIPAPGPPERAPLRDGFEGGARAHAHAHGGMADTHEDVVYEVAKFSMQRRSSVPLDVQRTCAPTRTRLAFHRSSSGPSHSRIPASLPAGINQIDLERRGLSPRAHDPKQSTQFTYARFWIPYLQNYKGWALFCDDDFLWLGDMAVRHAGQSVVRVFRVCSYASLHVFLFGPLARAHAHSSVDMWDAPSSRPPLRRGVKLGLLG
jgi:hypothetical protein